jgi:hypothetical protein
MVENLYLKKWPAKWLFDMSCERGGDAKGGAFPNDYRVTSTIFFLGRWDEKRKWPTSEVRQIYQFVYIIEEV